MFKNFNPLKSKTFWGSMMAVLGVLSQPDILSLLPPTVGKVITVVGAALAAVGIRDAIAANGVAATPSEADQANGVK